MVEQAMLSPLDAVSLARRISEFAPLPRALTEALRVLGQEDATALGCARAIEQDPALAARVLRLANSGFYGASKAIASVDDAVRLLGLRTVSGVLAAAALRGMLNRSAGGGFDPERYWVHSLCVALAARELAPALQIDPAEAFTAGLLHDVGRWMLATFHPQELARARAWAESHDGNQFRAEALCLGVSHAELGGCIVSLWHLPESTACAIACHHEPSRLADEAVGRLPALIHVADAIVHALDLFDAPDELVPVLDRVAWGWLELQDDAVLRTFAFVEESARKLLRAGASAH